MQFPNALDCMLGAGERGRARYDDARYDRKATSVACRHRYSRHICTQLMSASYKNYISFTASAYASNILLANSIVLFGAHARL